MLREAVTSLADELCVMNLIKCVMFSDKKTKKHRIYCNILITKRIWKLIFCRKSLHNLTTLRPVRQQGVPWGDQQSSGYQLLQIIQPISSKSQVSGLTSHYRYFVWIAKTQTPQKNNPQNTPAILSLVGMNGVFARNIQTIHHPQPPSNKVSFQVQPNIPPPQTS